MIYVEISEGSNWDYTKFTMGIAIFPVKCRYWCSISSPCFCVWLV